jgi:dolichol-phosphate mannosyltransferase
LPYKDAKDVISIVRGCKTVDSLEQRMLAESIDLILPLFNEQQVIEHTYRRLVGVLARLRDDGLAANVIFVDDGSFDDSPNILRNIASSDATVRVIRLSRNFGHQAAITAGLANSYADFSAVLDADLQDPPELIPDMLNLARQGYDIVYGQRTHRVGETGLKKITAALFYKVINMIGSIHLPENVGDFRLITRRARELFLQATERPRLNREIFCWVGLRQTAIPYARPPRHAGVSKYNVSRMCRLAMDGITNVCLWPIGLIVILATMLLVLSVLSLVVARFDQAVVLAAGMVVLYGLAVIGVYVGRMYFNLRARPNYLISHIARTAASTDASSRNRESDPC